MKRVAFLTYAARPELADDDRLALPFLKEAGVEVVPVLWDRFDDASQFDTVLLRSVWDYHERWPEFSELLSRLERQSVPVWNPIPLVRWNANKKYLLELASRGVALPPTLVVPQGDTQPLRTHLDRLGLKQAIVKPTVSANARLTYRIEDASAQEPAWREAVAEQEMLVQEYLPEIATDGEISLVYFAGVFSHAILKLPKAGDFRVQENHGGRSVPYQPSAQLIEAGQKVLAAAPGKTLYARVDGVQRGGQFLLMELEAVEPSLFLSLDECAPRRWAQAVAK